MRQALHRTKTQVKEESRISFVFVWILAIVCFMHNALICIKASTPHNALFGQQSAILSPLGGGFMAQLQASQRTGVPQSDLTRAYHRDSVRIREISAANIIQATAQGRLERADRHKPVSALEREGENVGDSVDIRFEPHHKEKPAWRGPAKIAAINSDGRVITVRFQGRTLDRRHQEARPHIGYLVFATGFFLG